MCRILGDGMFLKVSRNFWPIFLTREISTLIVEDQYQLIALQPENNRQVVIVRPLQRQSINQIDLGMIFSQLTRLTKFRYRGFDNCPVPIEYVEDCNEFFGFSLEIGGREFFLMIPILYSSGNDCQGTIGFVNEQDWTEEDVGQLKFIGEDYVIPYYSSSKVNNQAVICLIRVSSTGSQTVPISASRKVVFDGDDFVSYQPII